MGVIVLSKKENPGGIIPIVACGVFSTILGMLICRFYFEDNVGIPALCGKADSENTIQCAREWLGVAATALGGALTLIAAYVATRPVWHQFNINRRTDLKKTRASILKYRVEIKRKNKDIDKFIRIMNFTINRTRMAYQPNGEDTSRDEFITKDEITIVNAYEASNSILELVDSARIDAASSGIMDAADNLERVVTRAYGVVLEGISSEYWNLPSGSNSAGRFIAKCEKSLSELHEAIVKIKSAASSEERRVYSLVRKIDAEIDRG